MTEIAIARLCKRCGLEKFAEEFPYINNDICRGCVRPYNPRPTERKCRKCKTVKPIHEFHRHARFYFQYNCKACQAKLHKTYYQKNRERYKANRRKYYQKNHAKMLLDAKQRRAINKNKGINYWQKLKTEFLEAYGNKCICCGETEERFLTLEHMNGNGKEHRMRVGHSDAQLRDLKRREWPKDEYTILCYNCNMSTKWGDPCPHGNYARKVKEISS